MEKCNVEWCGKLVYAKGLCKGHYKHLLKWGEVRRTRFTPNEILIHDNYAEIVLYTSDGQEKARAKIDLEDVENVKDKKWCISGNGYVFHSHKGRILLHQEILGAKFVDHINNDRLDNRRANLREATSSQNMMNRKPWKRSKTGFKGVIPRGGKFIAAVYPNKVQIKFGPFDTAEEAAAAYNVAALKYYGEFAYLNVV